MNIGAADLLIKYGSPLKVAEALLRDELDPNDQQYVKCVVDTVILAAAQFRVQEDRDRKLMARAIRFAADVSDPEGIATWLFTVGQREALLALAARIQSGEVVVP